VQGVHIVCKECVDRGDLTSENIRRDIVEPSSREVKGVNRNNSALSSERNRVTEHSIRRSFARCALSIRLPGGNKVFL